MRLKILLSILVLLLLVVGLGFFYRRSVERSGLPQRSGELPIAGLSAAVMVRWDRWGVPHVEGESGEDLAAALGWLHANDRFVQLELGRRAAAGRLSELFGERSLALDQEARLLRLRRTAERMVDALGEESRRWLEAYARGVNAWIDSHAGDLPPLLRLAGTRPEPWQPADSLSFVMLMARDLSFWSGRPEERRFAWLRAFGEERTQNLLGHDLFVPDEFREQFLKAEEERDALLSGSGGGDSGGSGAVDGAAGGDGSDAAATAVEGVTQESLPAETLPQEGETDDKGGPLGSNNWALGGSRTASGKPLLANDPHLPLRLPGTWFEVLLRAPDYEAAGVTLPGLPGVVIGQSKQLAWALTSTQLDDHDVFLEEIDAEGRFQRGDEWVEPDQEVETIEVRDGEAVELLLLSTARGPVLPSDMAARVPTRSLAWTAYEAGDPLAPFLNLARATSVDEVPAAVEGYVAPAQNLVVADRDGGLLFTVIGRVPQRRRGDGRLPSPAWALDYGWDGLRPAESNPRVLRPPSDLVVTANNDVLPEDYPLPFVADFDDPFRADRIREQLEKAASGFTVAQMSELQNDVVDRYAAALVAALDLDGVALSDGARAAWEALKNWDARQTPKGVSALFALAERDLELSIFGDEEAQESVPGLATRGRLLRVLEGDLDAQWFDDVLTPEAEDRRAVVERALENSWLEGSHRWGEVVEYWDYGELHSLTLENPGNELPFIGEAYNRGPLPLAGSATTVAAFGGAWRDPRRSGSTIAVTYGPSMRFVADLANPDNSRRVLPGGQSGHAFDRHYDDQLPLYLAAETHEVQWSEEAIASATVSTLTMVPAAGGVP